MAVRPLVSLLVWITVIGALFASATPASACSPARWPPVLSESVDQADVIVVANVIGAAPVFSSYAALLVESYLKGSGPDVLLSTGYGFGGGDCHNRVYYGQRAVFFLTGDPNDEMHASYAYVYDSIHEASQSSIDAIVAESEQAIPPDGIAPFSTRLRAFGMVVEAIVILLISTLPVLVPLAGVILLLRYLRKRRRRRAYCCVAESGVSLEHF